MKKKMIVFLAFLLVFTSLNVFTYDAEAAAPKLNRKKKTMYVGDTFTLTLKNAAGKVKYSSTDKSIVTVSKDGVVTAIAPGKAKIKVKNNGKTYKCKFTVKKKKVSASSDDEAIYNAIVALKEDYPEGMPWTNANTYYWDSDIAMGLGYSGYGGGGCQAFAMIASDAAFGNVPAYTFDDPAGIRVGDIIRINGDTHAVIVLKIDGDQLTIAEGNYNSSIHWGRVISLKDCGFAYGFTRYPVE